MIGRAGIGWVIDHVHAPYVISVIAAGLGVACLLLRVPSSDIVVFGAAILLGLGLGAEVDLLAFLVSRYWPKRMFGRMYGVLFGCFNIGTGFGPLLIGMAFDRNGDYQLALTGAAICAVVVAAICFALPKYSPRET